MEIQSAEEAFLIACEMEKNAIRMYERALAVFDDPACQQAVSAMLGDERHHLLRFQAMGEAFEAQTPAPAFERKELLMAQAAGMLYSGGLMEAARKGAFDSVSSLYACAAEEEDEAVKRYLSFARQLSGDAAKVFSAIAEEEKSHAAQFRALAQP